MYIWHCVEFKNTRKKLVESFFFFSLLRRKKKRGEFTEDEALIGLGYGAIYRDKLRLLHISLFNTLLIVLDGQENQKQ